jgi:hypothetical protein
MRSELTTSKLLQYTRILDNGNQILFKNFAWTPQNSPK